MYIMVMCICGHQFMAHPKDAGRRARCPSCGRVLAIPTSAENKVSADEAVRIAQGKSRTKAPKAARASAPAPSSTVTQEPDDPLAALAQTSVRTGLASRTGPPRAARKSKRQTALVAGIAAGFLLLLGLLVFALLPGGTSTYGHSVRVIKSVVNGKFELGSGYWATSGGQPLDQSPGAVLVVGTEEGVKISGEQYPLGTILLVDKAGSGIRYRAATPSDTIELEQAARLLGKDYPPGPLAVPSSGRLPSSLPTMPKDDPPVVNVPAEEPAQPAAPAEDLGEVPNLPKVQ